MVPKIQPKFTKADIDKMIKEKLARIEEAIILMMQRIGETFVTDARNMGSYTDRTGKLRSSVGYGVIKKGELLSKGGFVKIKGSLSKKVKKILDAQFDGTKVGEAFLESLQKEFAEKYRNAIVLICVAGASYAAAVESKGFDVITGSSQIAVKQLQVSIERIRKRAA